MSNHYRITLNVEMHDESIDPRYLRWGNIFEIPDDGSITAVSVEEISGEDAILDRITEILYPMSEPRDHQWNGGDVCDALADLLREYRPEAQYRQKP